MSHRLTPMPMSRSERPGHDHLEPRAERSCASGARVRCPTTTDPEGGPQTPCTVERCPRRTHCPGPRAPTASPSRRGHGARRGTGSQADCVGRRRTVYSGVPCRGALSGARTRLPVRPGVLRSASGKQERPGRLRRRPKRLPDRRQTGVVGLRLGRGIVGRNSGSVERLDGSDDAQATSLSQVNDIVAEECLAPQIGRRR